MRAARRTLLLAALALAATAGTGCFAVAKRNGDLDRAPVVNTGAGATVIYPGQSAPAHPGNYHPREAGYGGVVAGPGASAHAPSAPPAPPPSGAAAHVPPGAVASGIAQPPPEYASRSGSGSSGQGGGGVSMLGGAEIEETRHIAVNEEPTWLKYAALPFAVLAAPFKYGADQIRGEPEPGPPIPRNDTQPRAAERPAPPATDYESARLQGLERELAQRGAPQAAPAPVAAHPYPSPAPAAGPHASIADELAALRARSTPQAAHRPAPPSEVETRKPPQAARSEAEPSGVVTRKPPQAARSEAQPSGVVTRKPPQAARSEAQPSGVVTTGQVDRDGDGRTDHWIERRAGVVVSERFDDDFDSQPDRVLVYDPATGEVLRIEEDSDRDGRIDTWTTLRGGQVSGRRVDTDGDGRVDTWSHYRAGVITRLERDADGDGFRDHVAYYRSGRLAREEIDGDGDGLTDLVKYYDDDERVARVEEDADGDGETDVVSHYESGRLTRREVLDTAVLETN